MRRHSQVNKNPIPLEPKIKATACKQSDTRRKEAEAVMAVTNNRVLRDYAIL